MLIYFRREYSLFNVMSGRGYPMAGATRLSPNWPHADSIIIYLLLWVNIKIQNMYRNMSCYNCTLYWPLISIEWYVVGKLALGSIKWLSQI